MLMPSTNTNTIILKQFIDVSNKLKSDDIYQNRLALILTDNIAEMLMQQKIDTMFNTDYKKEYSVQEKQEIDKDFNEKVACLLKKILIDQNGALIANACHELRNVRSQHIIEF